MWKAAESIDDRLVIDRTTGPALIAKRANQVDRKRLVLWVLAVLEGQIKKIPLLWFHRDIETLFKGGSRKSARNGIC